MILYRNPPTVLSTKIIFDKLENFEYKLVAYFRKEAN